MLEKVDFDLMTTVEQGGCSAKLPAQELDAILKELNFGDHPNLLIGADTSDDASVWRINDDTAIIQTTDFFPPVCSDPYEFGQIAAANALSDVFAMGGQAITALNLVMFPSAKISLSVLKEILRGGLDKTKEAGAVLTGGHSIDDVTPKYGLAVTGLVHPDKIIANQNAREGEVLILTKPIGSGIILAGRKAGLVSDSEYQEALDNMKLLNKSASEVMQKHGVRAATDVTGFSLIGHGCEMARASGVTLEIDSESVPLLEGAYRLADQGCLPCALFKNLKHVDSEVSSHPDTDYNRKMILFDAQTSGGILMSVPQEKSAQVLSDLRESGLHLVTFVGRVVNRESAKGKLIVIR